MLHRLFCTLLIFGGIAISCRQNPYKQGETLYRYHCGDCHMDDGSGLAQLIPPLDTDRLSLTDPAKLVCLIRNGLEENTFTGQKMPPNISLNDVEMANLINYLGLKYANSRQTIQVGEVKKMLANCQTE